MIYLDHKFLMILFKKLYVEIQYRTFY